ncbi:MAG: sulfatase-like hydrolase/transferase [Bacteroidetes bacterium]|nr:sulfatase-like hydrolase/transferase [Bacteroidota bacterium]
MKKTAVLLAVLTLVMMMCASCSNKGSIPEKPNIIFIIADDQAPQTLKAYGNEVCQTPNLDRLAAEGMDW